MGWSDLSKAVSNAESEGVDVDLSGFSVMIEPVLDSASWGAESGPREVKIMRGWTLVVDIDGGGGPALVNGDELSEHGVEVDLGTALGLAFDGKKVQRVSWEDLNVELPAPSDVSVDIDTGEDPSVAQGTPLQLKGPKGVSYRHGDPSGVEGRTVRIELLDEEFDASAECLQLSVQIEIPGVKGKVNSVHTLTVPVECSSCVDYTVDPPDLSPLEDLIDDAIEQLEQDIEAMEG
jgi:hypothetical protein